MVCRVGRVALSCSRSFNFHAGKLHRSRGAGCARGLLPPIPGGGVAPGPRTGGPGESTPAQKCGGGRRAAWRAAILQHANLLGPRGASRRAVAAFFAAPGRASKAGLLERAAVSRRPAEPGPISELLAAGRSARERCPGAAREREQRRSRPRAPARTPRTAQPVRVPSRGSGGEE